MLALLSGVSGQVNAGQVNEGINEGINVGMKESIVAGNPGIHQLKREQTATQKRVRKEKEKPVLPIKIPKIHQE
ncbi:MAG: hypothetical protein ACE37N_14835 [Pseudohongiellaceae bacterium]